jgi:hypothetical protein
MAGTCGYGEELSGSLNAGNFLTSGKVYRLASQEGLCSMEQVSNIPLYITTQWDGSHSIMKFSYHF